MRVAIPVKQALGLGWLIDTSLSECTELLLVDVAPGNSRCWDVVPNGRPSDCARMLDHLVAKHVDAVVLGRASAKQIADTKDAGIQAYVAPPEKARRALCSVLGACVRDFTGQAFCTTETPYGFHVAASTI